MARVTRKEIEEVKRALLADLKSHPPRIGIIGVSGTGKSSTINAMFKTNLAISHTRACTTQFKATPMELKMKSGIAKSEAVSLVVVDAPGLGEDTAMDPGYIDQYREQLPRCDVILWVLAARNRAMSLDQSYLKEFDEHYPRMVFGVNQVDLVHPMDWNPRINLPSVAMEANIEEIISDRADKIASVIGANPTLIPYSAEKGFNLEPLFTALIMAIPESRRFIYDALKDFSYHDFIPVAAQRILGGRTHEYE